MITYPVENNKRFALYDNIQNQVIKTDLPWPRLDGMPVHNLAKHLIYLEQTKQPLPVFDNTYYSLSKTKVVDTQNEEYRTEWIIEKRQIEDISETIKEVESEKLDTLINSRDREKLFLICLSILHKITKGIKLNEGEETLLSNTMTLVQKIQSNDLTLQTKLTAVNNGEEPDIKSDWQ
jgi:hypothetical protein